MKLAELKKLAAKHNIVGRSKMNKAQLEKALSRVRHSRKQAKKKSRKPANKSRKSVKKKSRKSVKKKSRKSVKKKSRKPRKKFIIMCDYTDKSIVLLGSTYAHKEEIKKAGGKYNPNLSVGKGWVFPKTKKKTVEKLVKKMRSAPAKSRKAVKKSRKKKAKKSKFKFPACAEYVCEHPFLCRPGMYKHNVYNIRVENGDLVANRCSNDQKETLVEGYTNDHTIELKDLDDKSNIHAEVKKGGETVLRLYKAGNSSGKCRSLNNYMDKKGCQDSDAIIVSSLRRERLGKDVLSNITMALSRSENQDRNLNNILGMAMFHQRIPHPGGRKVIDISRELRCKKGNEESCKILLLAHLWNVYSTALHASTTRGVREDFKKRNAKFAKYVKNMMKRVVGLESDQGGSDEEYEELQERLAALTGKPTHRSLMERLKRLKD